MPVFAVKSGAFFAMITGILGLMGGLLQINPIWNLGPYKPSQVSAGSQPDFHLDRCAPCQLLVLDGGEWDALMQLGALEHLELILSAGWQRRLQALEATERRRQSLRQRLGDATVDELIRIQSWLHEQPQRRELLALLDGDPI